MSTISHIYAVEFKPFMQEVIRYPALDGADLCDLLCFVRDAVRDAGKSTVLSVEQGIAVHNDTGEQVPFTAYRVYELPDAIGVGYCSGMTATEAQEQAIHALMHALRVGDEFVQEED